MSRSIVLIATLDTKGEEARFLQQLIEGRGHTVIVVDCGILGQPEFEPTVSRHAVASAVGTTMEEVASEGDKNAAISTMTRGAVRIATELYADGKLDGILALGGAQGTVIGTMVMKSLPLGVPKVMISAIANGQATFGPFVGTKDITVIHSVADILGLNFVTRQVLAEGAGAIVGMTEMAPEPSSFSDHPTVALTSAGVTTPSATRARELFEGWGYEVIAFHCNGIGAEAMEELVADGRIHGVLDLSPHDIIDDLFGGIMPAHADRMKATCRKGIPQVVVPGAADFILYGPLDSVPPNMLERKYVIHNPIHTHVKANRDEMMAVGRFVARRLCEAVGPAAVLIPCRGFSQLNVVGGPLFEPASDSGFVQGLTGELESLVATNVLVKELDMHINDASFAQVAARTLHALICGDRPEFQD